ncbi:glycosyltransferase family 4 protein [Lentiprolixibacter aurantiacus]|uniref:Glycosyltransferase family 4 protein n=1 Tax=Lentiprolixibacter aurantiacus TaxID=2993939 RepID=A0AAE3ML93_9FLAO|nr:glycosyltransferase family 4 protein [Lentiprolixibacter aurantiacus]MCX2719473.1 glycosyltransferase family 4 protein [Lentiprolixibacter aurantiacus]
MQKVLIITYYWPPAGGPGVQRWLKFARYLREFDVEPVIYTPSNADYPVLDQELEKELPEGIRVHRRPIFEPYRLARFFSREKTDVIRTGIIPSDRQSLMDRLLLWIRGNLFIPDARKFWVKPSIRFLQELHKKEAFDTIITTGPPHSVHLIGLQLKEQLKITWCADFRDPWTSIGYHKQLKLGNAAKKKHLRMEKQVLNTADWILVTSNTTKKEFEGITSKPVHVITNGYDLGYEKPEVPDSGFTISHIGSLLSKRNPENLWKILGELLQENSEMRKHLKLQLIGLVSQEVLDSLEKHGLITYTQRVDYVPHEEAIQYQKKSQVLLLLEIDAEETRGIIPGKLFEYLAARRPVLAVGPKEWEAGDLLVSTGAGRVFNYQEESGLKKVILEWFKKYQSGNLNVKETQITQFSRRELTRKLAQLLHGNRI